jgi:uncharacterized RDD family membrane protein YckC
MKESSKVKKHIKRASTIFLRGVIIVIGLAALAFCIFALPGGVTSGSIFTPISINLYMTAVPFFIALYQGLKLLGYIDKNKAFSPASIKALGIIKYCCAIISGIFAVLLPLLFIIADQDDAPGVAGLGLIITFGAFVLAILANVMQKLIHNAIAIKSENDLTV